MKATKHATQRLLARVGIPPENADEFFAKALEGGYPPSRFPESGEVRPFLESKRRGGSIVVHMGIVVVFGADGNAVTAYPLPAYLLAEYRKETNHD